MPDLMRYMHRPLRASKAPNLRAFLAALEAGIKLLSLKGYNAAMYLESASEAALQEWADAYAISIYGLDEAEARRTLQQDVLLRNRTTEAAIEAAIFKQSGISAAVRPSLPHVAFYDQQERAEQSYRMADYSTISQRLVGIEWSGPWGGEWPDVETVESDDDPTHLGFRSLTPRREGWGPEGFIAYMSAPYSAYAEEAVLAVLAEQAPSASGYSIFWSHEFERDSADLITFIDYDLDHPTHGFGEAPYGWNWGTPQ